MRNKNLHISGKIEEAMGKGEEIAKKYNPKTFIPFPFEEIFDEGNITAYFFPSDSKETWSHISGAIKFDEDKKTKIYINEEEPEKRRYFTVAHELGHYFLHKDDLKERGGTLDGKNILVMYRTDIGLSTEKEREANYFAGSLLMPKDRVKSAWKKFGDVDKCAELFNVSELAMTVRLNILGLID